MTDWFSEETLKEALDILLHEMPMALWETVYVTVLSTFFAVLIGLLDFLFSKGIIALGKLF